MMLVVDTNILFSFFWEKLLTKKLLITSNAKLISPVLALKEINKYSQEIIKKTKITNKRFLQELNKLKNIIEFASEKEYLGFVKKAEKISPDKNDSHFLALAMRFNCFLWSNNKLLQNQKKVKVLTTQDLIESLY